MSLTVLINAVKLICSKSILFSLQRYSSGCLRPYFLYIMYFVHFNFKPKPSIPVSLAFVPVG